MSAQAETKAFLTTHGIHTVIVIGTEGCPVGDRLFVLQHGDHDHGRSLARPVRYRCP